MIDYRTIRLLHRHGPDWVELEPRAHHDPADHDPERKWSRGRLFRCRTCDEEVMIEAPEDGGKRE